MIKAVIFDFDDTLCITHVSNHRMISMALTEMGCVPLGLDEFKKTVGDPLKTMLANYFPSLEMEEFMEHLNAIRDKLLAADEVENVPAENLAALDQLAAMGKQLFVVTSRREDGIKSAMDPKHHLGSRIAHFYHLGNNPYHKPDPKTFAVIEDNHGLKPGECAYIGDAINDAAAAKGAGLHFIASLESGLLAKEDFKAYEVDAFVSKLPEIVEIIRGMDND